MKVVLNTVSLVVVLMVLSLRVSAAEWTKETLDEIKKAVDSGDAVLVDVREKSEWDAGHVKGAISLPLSQMNDGLSEEELKLLPDDKVIYLQCAVGKRAIKARELLQLKRPIARSIKPGYQQLIEAGFPKAEK